MTTASFISVVVGIDGLAFIPYFPRRLPVEAAGGGRHITRFPLHLTALHRYGGITPVELCSHSCIHIPAGRRHVLNFLYLGITFPFVGIIVFLLRPLLPESARYGRSGAR